MDVGSSRVQKPKHKEVIALVIGWMVRPLSVAARTRSSSSTASSLLCTLFSSSPWRPSSNSSIARWSGDWARVLVKLSRAPA